MTPEYREKITKELVDAGAVEKYYETEYKIDYEDLPDSSNAVNDIAVSDDGIEYSKSNVMKYISDKGLPYTQESINLVAKMFQVNGNKLINRTSQKIEHNKLEDVDDELIDNYLHVQIAKILGDIKMNLNGQKTMDYAVDVIRDHQNGSTDLDGIKRSLNYHSKEGWRLKTIFTNELGHSAQSLSIKGIGSGVNATINEVVLIYERIIVE